MHIPTCIHEQNAYPGITNKTLAKEVDKVMLTVEDAKKHLEPKNEVVVTGLPVRSELLKARKDISRKVKSGVWARKEKGLYVAAKAPYGYVKDENDRNRLVVNEEEARIVKKIFQMYNKGKTMGEIARKLQDDKIYAPSYNGFEKNKNGKYGWTYSCLLYTSDAADD